MSARGQLPRLPRVGERLELLALGGDRGRLHARPLGSDRGLMIVAATGGAAPVPGERFDLEVGECRHRGARLWLGGRLSGIRLDVPALRLEPLALIDHGPWDPARDQLPARPPAPDRREVERLPPAAPDEPILRRALELWQRGERRAATELLGDHLCRELRCLEAHSGLGLFAFDGPPRRAATERARRHFEAGLRIGEQALGGRFRDVLPWSWPGNRPFLRCLHGYATCLWRLGKLDAARAGFERLCRLNPGDQLAARLALERIVQRQEDRSPRSLE